MQRLITGKATSVTQKRAESREHMTDLEKVRQWLLTYPEWEDTLTVDFVEAAPGNAGLFPTGMEEIERQEDILGNVQVHCRYRFILYRQTSGQADGTANAQWLLDFQNWVQKQCAAGQNPHFGDVPGMERMQAQKGSLKAASQVGTGTYSVTLIADFMKKYEVN